MRNRSRCAGSILLLASAAAVVRADTVQSFRTPAGGTAYAQTDPRGVALPELTDFGTCNSVNPLGPQRLVEGGRAFLRLAYDITPASPSRNCNAVTFNCVEPATTGQVAIDFDFRVTNPDRTSDPTAVPADGFSISLLRAGADLARGGPPIDVDEVATPVVAELPELAGSLGFGFRVYRGDRGDEPESVKILWDGALVQPFELPVDRTMVDIGWIHAAIRVDFDHHEVSVLLERADGSELLRTPAVAVPGLQPYATRVHLAARSGGSTANFDFDEINVAFPPRDPAVAGSWSPAVALSSVPIHAALLPGGQVLYWDRHDFGDGRSFLWDGITSTPSGDMPMKPGSDDMYDAFCAGHTFAADGSLFVAGGHIADLFGEPWVSRFDPVDRRWRALAPMHAGRWYPTATTLPDGDIAVVSGMINTLTANEIPEVYDARNSQWRLLTGARRPLPLYPFMFTTPKGLFAAGPMIDTGFVDVAPPGRWIPVDTTIAGRDQLATEGRNYGSAVLTDAKDGRILLVGGTALSPAGDETLRSTEWIDLSASKPTWQPGPAMTFARRMHVATVLPDGSVLVTGGTAGDAFDRADGAILNPEILTDLDDRWQPMACAAEARIYHSVAMLLPDARVLVAGGGHPGDRNIHHETAEIFSPPYLHRGAQLDAPAIVAGPGVALGPGGIARVSYGATIAYTTADPSRVAAVTWLRPAAVTHAFNHDQRIVRLGAGSAGIGAQVIAPDDPAIAPPGPYMMFLLDTSGVPSRAAWVRTNLPPEAVDDVFEIVEDQAILKILGRIVANDVDVERDATTVAIVAPPSHGKIVDGSYLPEANFAGEDSFTYTLSDDLDSSRVASVTIRIAAIADPPALPPIHVPPDDAGCCRVGSHRSPSDSFVVLVAVVLILARRRR